MKANHLTTTVATNHAQHGLYEVDLHLCERLGRLLDSPLPRLRPDEVCEVLMQSQLKGI